MKPLIKIITIAFLVATVQNANAQWIQITSGVSVNLNDVFFPTPSLGYIVGDSGTVLKTTDTGNTWQSIYTDSSLSFQSVYFTSVDTGYVAGGKLYKTTDGGITWIQIFSDTLNSVQEVYFVNNLLGFAGTSDKVYKTQDGGSNWSEIIAGNSFNSIYFPSPNVGYFIGGPDFGNPLYKTIDGGLTFIQITNGFQSIKEAVYFINDSVGYMAGWYNPTLVKTTNGGLNWQLMDTINWPACWDVYFNNESTGYLITNGGGNSIIKNTTDGGTTWTTQLNLAAGSWWLFKKFFFIDPIAAVVIGDYGTIYKTTNGGVGINENKKKESEIKVYPNPSNENIRIEIAKEVVIKNIKLHDLNGKLIKAFSPTNTLLNIADIAQGKYLLIITTDKGTFTEKIIKQ